MNQKNQMIQKNSKIQGFKKVYYGFIYNKKDLVTLVI